MPQLGTGVELPRNVVKTSSSSPPAAPVKKSSNTHLHVMTGMLAEL